MTEYIEREAAIQAASIWNGDEGTEAWIQSALKKLPAADVAPVRHGRWVKNHDNVCYWHECSECGERPPKDQWENQWLSSFCPNCGAKMDGGET